MNRSWKSDWPTVVAGFGSAHGDDQAGWRLAAMLQHRPHVPARVIAVYESTQVLEALEGCQRLIIVDACQSGGSVGAVTRLQWPDPRIAVRHRHSTHGVGVYTALKLAERLGELPPVVEIYGIEVAGCSPGRDISPEVLQAVAELEAQVFAELREVTHA
jgi:hydrogenase maturation protease